MKSTNAVRTEIHYAQVGDYQLPLLTLTQTDNREPLGKYPAPDKERAQLLWVAHMNGLKAQAEEVVVREVVYAE